MVHSETSKPSMRSSPWIRGAPQAGFSETIRKMRPRTFLEIRFPPITLRAFEMTRQYRAKPARCHRTTVVGLTMVRACFQPDHSLRMTTQNNLSKVARRRIGCLRSKAVSCCQRTRFSSKRLRCVRRRRSIDAKVTPIAWNMGRWYCESLVQSNSLYC
jgi:hypothetical protein